MGEEQVNSRFLALSPNGLEVQLYGENSLSNVDDKQLKSFIKSDVFKKAPSYGGIAPPHIEYMQKLELVDYEPAADVGHLRFYPKGEQIMDLLEELAYQIALKDLNAMKIKTPIMYNTAEPDIEEQAKTFREKDYEINVHDKNFLLRFASDFGLFRMMKDAQMSYYQLPVRIYEIAPSFRLEQSGEVSGLRRLRAFTMPDIHSFCTDLKQGNSEFSELYKYYDKLMNLAELPFTLAFRTTEDFWNTDKDLIVDLLKISKKPALIELLEKMKHYWVVKQEFQYVDSFGHNAQLSTVQLDIMDGKRYGINYVDKDQSKKPCTIVHSSMGSLERWMYAILEEAYTMTKKGEPPSLPVWLSPMQLRLIPVSSNHLSYAEELGNKIASNRIRVDIDDREETVSKRIRDAEKNWVPYTIVIGDEELSKGTYNVRIRRPKITRGMSYDELINEITEKTKDKPYRDLYVSSKLSKRIKFR